MHNPAFAFPGPGRSRPRPVRHFRTMTVRIAPLLASAALLCSLHARADAPTLHTETPFVPKAMLEAMVQEILTPPDPKAPKDEDVPGLRLRVHCYHHPLPPGWVADAKKNMSAWTCAVAWERKVSISTASFWAAELEDLIIGTTDGDTTALQTTLKNRLTSFIKLKPKNGTDNNTK